MEQKLAWAALLAAGICEVAWAVGLKYAEGFTRLMPSAISIFFMVASVLLLSYALRSLPLGMAYAIWTGIGAVGTAIVSTLLFQEAMAVGKAVSMAMIVIGIVGLKLAPQA